MTAPCWLTLLFVLSSGPDNPADQAWEAYLSGDFLRVDSIAAASLNDTALTPQIRSCIFVAWGCAEALRSRKAAATAAFERAFELSPELRFTAADLPPPVWQVFQPVQERLEQRIELKIEIPRQTSPLPQTVIRDTVRVKVPILHSSTAVLKSLVWPGWGHIDESQTRGWTLAIVHTGLTASFIGSLVLTADTRRDYLNAREADDINRFYNRYNNAYRAAWLLGAATLTSYLYAQWDFFSSPPVGLSVELKPASTLLSVTAQF